MDGRIDRYNYMHLCIYIYIIYIIYIYILYICYRCNWCNKGWQVSKPRQPGCCGGPPWSHPHPTHPTQPCQTARSARSNESVEKSPRPSAAELSPQSCKSKLELTCDSQREGNSRGSCAISWLTLLRQRKSEAAESQAQPMGTAEDCDLTDWLVSRSLAQTLRQSSSMISDAIWSLTHCLVLGYWSLQQLHLASLVGWAGRE
jgi:hypothetical protein